MVNLFVAEFIILFETRTPSIRRYKNANAHNLQCHYGNDAESHHIYGLLFVYACICASWTALRIFENQQFRSRTFNTGFDHKCRIWTKSIVVNIVRVRYTPYTWIRKRVLWDFFACIWEINVLLVSSAGLDTVWKSAQLYMNIAYGVVLCIRAVMRWRQRTVRRSGNVNII